MVAIKVGVVGAGVVGLTTAVKIQEQVPGVQVRNTKLSSYQSIKLSSYEAVKL